MKKFLVLLLSIMLLAGIASAEEKADGFLGKPFPDFSVTDTEGNTFTLSEALKDHEAVLINFWATWCNPCRREFPYLNEAYEKYRDKVAFIALSTEKRDTPEKIAEFKKIIGVSLPMGRDEDKKLYKGIPSTSLPSTVIVDRFGNTVFFHPSSFSRTEDVEHVLELFLGDSYTETAVSTWEPAKADENTETDENEEDDTPSYFVYVIDQNGDTVGNVSVNFCTDTASFPETSDERGIISFIGVPAAYHVQIVSVPDGYSWEEEDEIDTSDKGGKFLLTIRKD